MSAFDKLLSAVTKAKSGSKDYEKDVFYYPVLDASSNGSAVIRFLPGLTEDDDAFVKQFAHGFKHDNGKWFIENCPTTIGEPCLMCEKNSVLWNTGLKDQQEIVRQRKRKTSYIARILVIEDKKNPENVGKVFKYKFGAKIFTMISDKFQPEFADEDPCNIFDLKTGANFKLKIRKVEGQINYDKSEFSDPSECNVDVFSQFKVDNDIAKFIAKESFKTPEKMQESYNRVFGTSEGKKQTQEDDEEFEQVTQSSSKQEPKRTVVAKEEDQEDSDLLALVRSLAE